MHFIEPVFKTLTTDSKSRKMERTKNRKLLQSKGRKIFSKKWKWSYVFL